MSVVAATMSDQAQAMWRKRLTSAVRAAMACTIVGCTTLYGPPSVRDKITFPAFSYVTAILLTTEATLGNTLLGCWHVFCATFLVLPPSVFVLWAIGPTNFTAEGASLGVAISGFLVALMESTSLTTKRIAFGQLVIIYVGAVVRGNEAGSLMHPVHVGASTGLGALASIVALLLPYPQLAYNEVRLYVYTDDSKT